MNHFILPGVVGCVLLALLLYWLLQGGAANENQLDLLKIRETLADLQLLIRSQNLVARMFDPKDLEFVRAEGDPVLVRLLNRERKAAIVGWMRRMRLQVSALMAYRISYARGTKKLRPTMELRLTLEYVTFLMTYYALIFLVWLWGPFHARRLVGSAIKSVGLFCGVFEDFVSSSVMANKQLSEM